LDLFLHSLLFWSYSSFALGYLFVLCFYRFEICLSFDLDAFLSPAFLVDEFEVPCIAFALYLGFGASCAFRMGFIAFYAATSTGMTP
jgi:hypothetical protein